MPGTAGSVNHGSFSACLFTLSEFCLFFKGFLSARIDAQTQAMGMQPMGMQQSGGCLVKLHNLDFADPHWARSLGATLNRSSRRWASTSRNGRALFVNSVRTAYRIHEESMALCCGGDCSSPGAALHSRNRPAWPPVRAR